ncbi:adenylate kinase [Boudabousia liubingyangii]|uniref:Adenylate kinase n=1 Tax=Boudabousia liubingyangii TaxID=1921764 RepID=A0A1Q5PQI3_9ACTO|nr:adenylate kinase [Boudabousia liubingyangii]OKL48233.1 adenylate kinase [Boudabousia liubingyangii]OKL49732.1 adenylate kinase [Boudabousia liubingyangii]
MTRMILIGPPGAGKGTQAKHIAERLNIPHISTGEIFRRNITEGTELGVRAKSYIDKGEYVPDSVTNPMVEARLAAPDTENGFLLDGYPRTVAQARVLHEALASMGSELDLVLEIDADLDEVVKRMLHRAELEHRPDDTEDVIRHRLEVYTELTEPMATYYEEHDLLRRVDGNGTIEEVTARIDQILDEL